MLKNLLDLIIPHRCVCGDIIHDKNSFVCAKCWGDFEFISSKSVCTTCGNPFEFDMPADSICSLCIEDTPDFDKARSVFKYNDFSGKIISGFKYHDKTAYKKILAHFIKNKIGEVGEDFDIITSVPIHPRKLISRKYNQSAMLANELGKLLHKKPDNLILRKVKNITAQAGLKRSERIKSIKNSFTVDKKYIDRIKGKNILLIDDVITTGATSNECARTLKNAGVAKVCLLTAARTMLDR